MRTYNNLKGAKPPKHVEDLRQLVKSSAEMFGDKPIYIYRENGETKESTYIDQYEQMNALGTALFLRGLDGARIAVIGDTHPHWLVTFKAVVNSGGVIVPLDRELETDQVIEFMKIAGCSAVVYTSCFNNRLTSRAAELPGIKYFIPIQGATEEATERVIPFAQLLTEGKKALDEGDTRMLDFDIDMEKMCAILFTSGTTGTAKGVMLSQNNFTAAVNSSCLSMSYDDNTTYVSVLPIHHTYELTCAHLATSNLGSTTFISEGLKYASRNFKEFKPNCLVLVPLFLETVHKRIWDEIKKKGMEKKVKTAMKISDGLLKTGVDMRQKLFSDILSAFGGNLKSIVVGGAPLDAQIVRDFYSFGITVLQGYGITECSPLVAVNRPGRVRFDSVGQPVEGCEVKIDPIAGEEDGAGEILARGGNIMMGYYENPEATAEVFTPDGWFRTGDIGTMDDKGYIKITGRSKNVIIASNGKNVYPEELEERLSKIEAIKESVVVGRVSEGSREITLTALIYPNYELLGENISDAQLKTHLKEKIADVNRAMPPYKHINRFELVKSEFEKTPSKKIKRFLYC